MRRGKFNEKLEALGVLDWQTEMDEIEDRLTHYRRTFDLEHEICSIPCSIQIVMTLSTHGKYARTTDDLRLVVNMEAKKVDGHCTIFHVSAEGWEISEWKIISKARKLIKSDAELSALSEAWRIHKACKEPRGSKTQHGRL